MLTATAGEVKAPVQEAHAPAVRVSPAETAKPTRVETHLGRPATGEGGTARWEPSQAPAPAVGKVTGPKEVAANGALPKPVETTEHLTAAEVSALQQTRKALESKGQANLNAGDREQIRAFKYAEEELVKPFGNDPVRRGLVSDIRKLMGSEARGAVSGAWP